MLYNPYTQKNNNVDLNKYYIEICKEPIIDRETEYDLFLQYQDQGLTKEERAKIGDRIVRSNLRFVFRQAKTYSKNDPELFEELIGAGNEGLLVGLEKYVPNPEVRFLSYAGWWVKQRILKQMASMRIVSLPICKQQLSAKIQKANSGREKELTLTELKEKFPETTEKDLRELCQTQYLTYYLDDVGDDPSLEIDPIRAEVETRLDNNRLHDAVAELPSPHKEIIEMSYGLIDDEEESRTEISKKLGIPKDQLKNYKQEALEMLKNKLGTYF